MEENMSPETIWTLKQILAKGERDLAEGKFYTHEQVKAMSKAHRHERKIIATIK